MQDEVEAAHGDRIDIAVCTRDLTKLFEEIAYATFALLTDLASVAPRESHCVRVWGGSYDELLRGWLQEMLAPRGGRHLLFCSFEIAELDQRVLLAHSWGEQMDHGRH